MAEQLTRLTGRIKQKDDAPFFLVNIGDIDAAEAFGYSSKYPNTSLLVYLQSVKDTVETAFSAQPIPEAAILALFEEES